MRTDFAQLRRLPDLLFPRRCPFCGSLLGPDALQGTVCPACVPEEMRLQHIPARLPEGEHDFYAVREAATAYYYEDIVRTAVLRCKRGGCFWYARELADRVAVLVFGALPAKQPGKMPQYAGVNALPLYSCIVPVPSRQPLPGMPGLPLLLALALAFYCLWRAQARGDTRPAADTAVHQAPGPPAEGAYPRAAPAKRQGRVWLPPRHRPDRQAGAAGR